MQVKGSHCPIRWKRSGDSPQKKVENTVHGTVRLLRQMARGWLRLKFLSRCNHKPARAFTHCPPFFGKTPQFTLSMDLSTIPPPETRVILGYRVFPRHLTCETSAVDLILEQAAKLRFESPGLGLATVDTIDIVITDRQLPDHRISDPASFPSCAKVLATVVQPEHVKCHPHPLRADRTCTVSIALSDPNVASNVIDTKPPSFCSSSVDLTSATTVGSLHLSSTYASGLTSHFSTARVAW